MRNYFLIFLLLTCVSFAWSQELNGLEKGKVSYISSQNVYVKFASTGNINIGDTLFLLKNGQLTPSLVVNNKSSISCVCAPIGTAKISISDDVIFQKGIRGDGETEHSEGLPKDSLSSYSAGYPLKKDDRSSASAKGKSDKTGQRQSISGRISAASYNTFANSESNNRFRYTFLIRGDHVGNTGLSFESYITFRHNLGRWEEVKDNINSALKIYALSIKYDFNETTRLLLGRNINPRITSIGASDGLQFEKGLGNFTIGALVGSRPDHLDYSYNYNLFQYGLYLSHELSKGSRYLQNTFSFIEQRNDFKIDRRFIYFQHSSAPARNLNLFASMELSLYENINDEPKNVLDLTNLYASIRYRPIKPLSLSVSYDNRKNVQYYETFKNYIDSLIDRETRQGIRFHGNYRVYKNIIWGINTAWRFQKSEGNLSRNLNSYLTFTHIPGVNIQTTLTANFLETNYLKTKFFGIRVSKDIVPPKLNGDINYRWVDYDYLNYEKASSQNIIGAN